MQANTGQAIGWPYIVLAWILLGAVLLVQVLLRPDGVPLLADTDDAMRMVTATDLLHGQPWQDISQYRDNVPFGTTMHWSRLPDAPLALLMAILTPVAGDGASGLAAAIWPMLLLFGLLVLSVRLSEHLVPEADALAPLALPALSLVLLVEFLPGRVDHHNIQILLTLALALSVILSRTGPRAACAAGIVAATSLAIGMEGLPHVVMAIAAFAVFWAEHPARHSAAVRAFGGSLAVGLAGHWLLATAPPSYFAPSCDALSITQVAAGGLAAGALVGATVIAHRLRGFWPRLAAMAVLLGGAAGAVLSLFPACLAGAYGALDPALAAHLFPSIAEMQPWAERFSDDPAAALAIGVPLLAGLGIALRRSLAETGERRVAWLVLLAFLVAGVLVTIVQIRGARLAAGFCLPAGVYAIEWARDRLSRTGRLTSLARLVACWLAFSGVVQLPLLAGAIAMLGPDLPQNSVLIASVAPAQPSKGQLPPPAVACFDAAAYSELAALPKGRVIAPLRLGAHILHYTEHGVVSAGFHRNGQGTKDVLSFFSGEDQRARAIVVSRGLDYLVVCPGLETGVEPDGLVRALALRGSTAFPFLTRLSDGISPLQIYAVGVEANAR